MPEMLMKLKTFYIQFVKTDPEQCGDGQWLAKLNPTSIRLNCSKRITTKALEKIKVRQ